MSWANTRRRIRRRRRWQGLLQVAFLVGGAFSVVGFCLFTSNIDPHPHFRSPSRTLLQNTDPSNDQLSTSVAPNVTVKSDPLFPPDLFTEEQRLYKGAIICHILGMVYMFIALAIVCDEFFVPALDVIIEKLQISEDVAGATFMAAGGSAPELFTSVIGVFISFNDVGIGTIVGSAVFNILFVIAMCVLFSKTVLDLTWWPIFRDITFYSIALLLLVIFFLDSYIYWYEALMLFFIYLFYCTFMKINETIEKFVKKHINKNKVTRVGSTDHLVPNHQAAAQQLHQAPLPAPVTGVGRRASVPVLHSGTKFRQGLLQLMIHTIDPLHDGKVDEKATQLHAIASLKVLLDATKPQNGRVETYRADGLSPDARPDAQSHLSGRSSQGTEVTHIDSVMSSELGSQGGPQTNGDLALDNSSLGNNVSYGARAIRRISYKAAQNGENNMLSTLAESDDPETLTPVVSTPFSVNSSASYRRKGLNPPTSNEMNGKNGQLAKNVPHTHMVPLQVTVKPAAGGRQWSVSSEVNDLDPDEEEDETKPIDLSWPDTTMKRITYIIVAPIIFPLWITLPDTRTPRGKRFFFVTFLGSILWIAIFSYLMVWWASVVGETIKIPPEVMGLTILAAGTSVPDLITSVIVARKGFGDMAVSSSIGSNIFDVCCGLPIPWLLYAFGQLCMNFYHGRENPWSVEPIQVSSGGMACSILLLFTMLMFVLFSIICSRWKMNKGLGVSMFFLYFAFVVISLSFEYDWIVCPV